MDINISEGKRLYMMFSAILLSLLLFSQAFMVQSAEVDSFTQRNQPLADALTLVNHITQSIPIRFN